jgi:hypothetical protein
MHPVDLTLINLRSSLASASAVSADHLRQLQSLDPNGDWIGADCTDPDLLPCCIASVDAWIKDAGI